MATDTKGPLRSAKEHVIRQHLKHIYKYYIRYKLYYPIVLSSEKAFYGIHIKKSVWENQNIIKYISNKLELLLQ